MKTAISLPDDLFVSADTFAARTGRSRSELYVEALREYLQRHDQDQITASLDDLASEIDTSLDPAVAHATRRLYARETW
ncbi:MAG: CopG family ribbon-helix-helix protein [Anaerolineae bacterium]|jgi:metal-responsive CopG/Arc/MetJ family transcriptional regulator|nr:ChpI protein [Ardenticatenia bacterium]HQZ70214.1 ChpI protein [Anaerolineae bacterium]HRA20578.1 ChpI protein [Anaerolineae bacterium]